MRLPPGFQSTFVQCGPVRLHAVTNNADPSGDPRLPFVFLHGFPEFWIAWEGVFARLAEEFCVVAPDQRGFNLSDAPAGAENYAVPLLVGDLASLAGQLLGHRKFVLCGHDWGASVAYAASFRHPERIAGLVIANGVHPVPFQRALVADAKQRAASQYFHYLRAPDAAAKMAEDSYRRTFGMFEKFSAAPWLTAGLRAEYLAAWSRPGRMDAMLNWYRASPIVVPSQEDTSVTAPLADAPAGRFQVTMPHLLIWGSADIALRPASTKGLEEFAPKLQRLDLADADHWLLHTHAPKIAEAIRAFTRTALPQG
jgi:pimeloyl-ACP methyl ester carboxylesterase